MFGYGFDSIVQSFYNLSFVVLDFRGLDELVWMFTISLDVWLVLIDLFVVYNGCFCCWTWVCFAFDGLYVAWLWLIVDCLHLLSCYEFTISICVFIATWFVLFIVWMVLLISLCGLVWFFDLLVLAAVVSFDLFVQWLFTCRLMFCFCLVDFAWLFVAWFVLFCCLGCFVVWFVWFDLILVLLRLLGVWLDLVCLFGGCLLVGWHFCLRFVWFCVDLFV